jgi:hypothetical protein
VEGARLVVSGADRPGSTLRDRESPSFELEARQRSGSGQLDLDVEVEMAIEERGEAL